MSSIKITANGQEFTFPDGTSEEEINSTIEGNVSQQKAPVTEGAKDESATSKYARIKNAMKEGTISDFIQEPAMSIASNLAGKSLSGITQIATAPFIGIDDAIEKGREIESSFNSFGNPKTSMGQQGLEAVTDAGQFVADEFNQTAGGIAYGGSRLLGADIDEATDLRQRVTEDGAFPVMADATLDATGSPALATGVSMIPEVAGAVIPINRIATHGGKQTIPNQEIAVRIKEGDLAGDLAQYKIDAKGNVNIDSTAQEAMDIGMSSGFIQELKQLPPPEGIGVLAPDVKPKLNPTKLEMLKMLKIKKRGTADTHWGDKNRATDVIGDRGLVRLNHIKDINRKAGRAIDIEANKLKGKEVDFSVPVANFSQNLKDMGVKYDAKTGEFDFKGSDIEGITGLENIVNRVVTRMASGDVGKMPSAYDVHRLKRYLDKNIGYGKQIEGIDSDVEHLLRQLRTDLDDTLDNKFPDYDKANTAYAETIDLIKEMKSLAGTKVDLTGASANRAVGQTLRKALTNYQAGSRVKQVISDMDDISRKYGGSYDDDLNMLISFDNNLDKIFGASARGGFESSISSGVSDAIRGMTDGRSTKQKATDYVIKKLRPADKDAFDVIERSIRNESNPWRN